MADELNTNTTETNDAQPSVRDALEAAFTKHEAGDAAAAPAVPAPAPAPGIGAAPAAAPPAAPAIAPAGVQPQAPAVGAGAQPVPGASAPASAQEALKAPQSWKADLRERWNALPRDVQAEVIRREAEHEDNMRHSAGIRRFAQEFSRISEPYRALMEVEGADPLAAYHDYLKTSALLRMGQPQDKARAIAQLVQQFAIPLDALDAFLAASIRGQPIGGAPMQQQQPIGHQQQFRDPRVDELLANMRETQAEERRSAVADFANDGKHEFFEDVRLTMADVMDAAAKRGIRMGLEDAYVRACQIEPGVKKVLDERAARGSVAGAARTLAAARHASSSLPPQGAAPAARSNGALPANPSVRQSLEAAWEQAAAAQ